MPEWLLFLSKYEGLFSFTGGSFFLLIQSNSRQVQRTSQRSGHISVTKALQHGTRDEY